jgi:hypothetical protein
MPNFMKILRTCQSVTDLLSYGRKDGQTGRQTDGRTQSHIRPSLLTSKQRPINETFMYFHPSSMHVMSKLMVKKSLFVCLFWRHSHQWARASSFTSFLDHRRRRTTLGRTTMDERSARRRDLCLTTHNSHNRPTT